MYSQDYDEFTPSTEELDRRYEEGVKYLAHRASLPASLPKFRKLEYEGLGGNAYEVLSRRPLVYDEVRGLKYNVLQKFLAQNMTSRNQAKKGHLATVQKAIRFINRVRAQNDQTLNGSEKWWRVTDTDDQGQTRCTWTHVSTLHTSQGDSDSSQENAVMVETIDVVETNDEVVETNHAEG